MGKKLRDALKKIEGIKVISERSILSIFLFRKRTKNAKTATAENPKSHKVK